MRFRYLFSLSLALGLGLISCDNSPHNTQSKGFRVPEGDVVVGENLFKEFQCYGCHSIAGVEMPKDGPNVFEHKIPLGGESYQIKSYGELVTSIIDPNHSIASSYLASLPEDQKKGVITSPMVVYNEDMTVQDLINLAAFLHARYIQKPNPFTYYYYPF